uniref:START domain-containing protein n=1 Tax=Accipiter nisus TaxID=211598 RepID=A0A8B9RX11_9AVES
TPWVQGLGRASLSPQCRIDIPDEPAERCAYDVLRDVKYRWKRDSDVTDTRGITQLAANADVGYCACEWGRCPKPLKNGVVVTRRSLQVEDGYHAVTNFSVRHLKYPPCEELTAVSLPAGYLAHSTGPNSCSLTYLAQVDPKGNSLPWLFPLYFSAPDIQHKACVKYPAWKQQHDTNMKPWLYPEQNKLPLLAQCAASLENVDESSLSEAKDERGDHNRLEN